VSVTVLVTGVLVPLFGLINDRRLGGVELQPCVLWLLSDSPEPRTQLILAGNVMLPRENPRIAATTFDDWLVPPQQCRHGSR
jgi:hypothetical protein